MSAPTTPTGQRLRDRDAVEAAIREVEFLLEREPDNYDGAYEMYRRAVELARMFASTYGSPMVVSDEGDVLVEGAHEEAITYDGTQEDFAPPLGALRTMLGQCEWVDELWGPHPGCREFMTEPEAVVRCEHVWVRRVVDVESRGFGPEEPPSVLHLCADHAAEVLRLVPHERVSGEHGWPEGPARCCCGWVGVHRTGHGLRDSEWRNHKFDCTGSEF